MHLTLHLTTACNMHCSYCYAPPHDSQPMTARTGRKALDFGVELTRGSCGIVFFGGEPLLHKELIRELVAYGRQKESRGEGVFHFKLTTNGTLLDEELVDFAERENVLVAVSLDGVRESHDRHRRFTDGRPTFTAVRRNLAMLLRRRPYSNVLMVVNPDTAVYLAESVAELIEMDCRYVIVSLNYAAAWKDTDLEILQRQFEVLGDFYVRWMRAGRKFYLSPFEVKISSHVNKHCFQRERCELARRQLSVDPAGYLFPCVQFTRAGRDSEWCIGHVDSGIEELKRERIHRASQREKGVCAECAIRKRCNHTCGCLNWQTTGSINRVSPVLCRYEKMLVPIADQIAGKLYEDRLPLFLHKHYNSAYPVLSLLEDSLEGQTARKN